MGQLPISTETVTGENQDAAFNPANVFVEFLNRCSGANLDMENCLVSSTVSAFMGMENGPQRKLQTNEEGCGGPDINEESLRLIMDGTKAQCIQSGVSITNQEFDSTVTGFMTIFGSDCFCTTDDEESRLMLMEITLEVAAECAQVVLDMPQCLKDHLVLTLSSTNPGMDSATSHDGIQRKLHDPSSSCEQSYLLSGLAMNASTMLEDGKAKCAALDVSVGTDQIIKAHSDLVSIFSAQQCWGLNSDPGCEGETSDDELGNTDGVLNGLSIAIRYIEQCAGLELDIDSCLISNSISALLPAQRPLRELQLSDVASECIAPELSDLTLSYIVGKSAAQCSSKGVDSSADEVAQAVTKLVDFFSAQECWVALCEEQANPSPELYKLFFEEIGQCAGAHFDWNPCLRDQVFAFLSSDTPNSSLERIRRKLQSTFEPCTNDSGEAEFIFLVNMLLAGAEESCLQIGETIAPGDVSEAQAELLKLFTAQQCWGTSINCAVPQNDYRSAYLTFVETRISMMLSACVGAEANTCVFNRSVEVMQGMKLLGWSLDGHSALSVASESTLCIPLTISATDIDEIVKHAQAFCFASGTPALNSDEYNQSIEDLNTLVDDPTCWDDLCQPSVKNFIMQEWMEHCTSLNLDFLLNQAQSNTALDIEMVGCMVSYILSKEENIAPLTCGTPLSNLVECGLDIGGEAFIHCGGEMPLPAATTAPPMQFSMSFSIDDWFPSEENGQEVGAYIDEACTVIEYLHSSMTPSCLQPVCAGLWIEDTLTVDEGAEVVDDDGTDEKSTIDETPAGSAPLTPQPTKQPTPPPTSKSTTATKTNDSPSSGRAAALSLVTVLAFSSILMA
jgi:hypothetical protein